MIRRLAVFLFGIVVYLIFLITVLYGIGFTGNIWVPKAIDNGSRLSLVDSLAIDILLIAFFGLQHSVIARRTFKTLLLRWIPEPTERSIFVLCASLLLLLLFWQWRPLAGDVWDFPTGWPNFVLRTLFGVGWALVVASTFLIDHFDLFGLRQVALYLRGIPYTPVAFKQPAIYRAVRHPMMFGFLIAFWVTPQMSLGHLLFASGMTIYILLGIRFEEGDLLKNYGQTYKNYRHQVPMLLPLPKRK